MQKNMTDRTPGSYDDFVAYLGTVRTEEELFSRLTYWFAGQDRPEDVLSRSELVEARAKELGFWQGLTFRGGFCFLQIVEERLWKIKERKKAVQGTIYHLTKQYYSGLWMIMIFLMKNPEK